MSFVVDFLDPQCTRLELVGGKGASLGRMTHAELPVPSGFVVTTAAYREFVQESGLHAQIMALVDVPDDRSAPELEKISSKIHELITGTAFPAAVADAISGAYLDFDGAYVAVRSSGTAEDLEGASFAGLHESYLDVRGRAEVLDAVRRCWASMWTGRAIAYREHKGFAHSDVALAVVVQRMVPSEAAGVLFTGNPRTLRADEYIVNASWGLGEAVVLGKITPDEFVLERETARVKRRSLGSKEVRIDRDPENPSGTAERATTPAERSAYVLSDGELRDLVKLGRRVTEYYDGLPQDIEWGLVDGAFALLQARPVTGVEFSWDEDCEDWQIAKTGDDDIWTYSFASMGWNGAVTPLFYSIRAKEFTDGIQDLFNGPWGCPELAERQWFKFRRSAVYMNSSALEEWARLFYPSFLRPGLLVDIAPPRHEVVLASGFSWSKYLRMLAGLSVAMPEKSLYGSFRTLNDYYDNRVEEANGLPPERLRELSDRALEHHAREMMAFAKGYIDHIWTPFFVLSPTMFALLGTMLQRWCSETSPAIMQDLVSGLPSRTLQFEEDLALWHLGDVVRTTPALQELIEAHEGADFFAACRDSEAGRAFLQRYEDELLVPYAHRGHADRDIYFARRCEDPDLDYRSLRALAKSEGGGASPEEAHERLVARRLAATEEVLADLRKKPLGALRCEAFKLVLDWLHLLLVTRDDNRSYCDRFTLAKKRAFGEIGRRCVERGLLAGAEDYYFLTLDELFGVFRGAEPGPLLLAKIEARSRVFHASMAREEVPPFYLVGDTPTSFDVEVDDGSTLRGSGIANGKATGRARLVPRLEDIGCLEKGDILVCNSTDPGWTSVFALVGGVIIETGGILAHAACLSREFGIPCVSLPGALRRVTDGAEINIDGTSGEVSLVEDELVEA